MPRQPRIVLPNIPHHITQRGNYKQTVFQGERDFKTFSTWVNEYAQKYELDILAFCLMSNHFHFIVVPNGEESLARAFNILQMRYAQYINRKRKANGHVWQGRFFSCLLDDAHLYRAIRYVERNPVRAKVVKHAWEYQWSSANEHVGRSNAGVIRLSKKFKLIRADEWKEYLKEKDLETCDEMRIKTMRGLVVGREIFVKKLENKLKRSLQCLNPGRPRKS